MPGKAQLSFSYFEIVTFFSAVQGKKCITFPSSNSLTGLGSLKELETLHPGLGDLLKEQSRLARDTGRLGSRLSTGPAWRQSR